MITQPSSTRVLLCTQPTDMRKSFDGLIAATKQVLGQDPLSKHLFVFVNRRRTQVKALYWASGGYCVWAQRLERSRFAALCDAQSASVAMSAMQWLMWLDGIDLESVRRKKCYHPLSNTHEAAIMST